jgi:nitroimidazol reductase NimA-like FMN-containing flavoprotein (pyridoxamine 5'-phosphate oxidase superfamily)
MTDAALEQLGEQECIAHLKEVNFGRLVVVTAEGRPEIFPVNFALRGRSVVVVTSSPVIRARGPLGHVAFEADCIDPVSHEGWDVVVSGEGADITDTFDDTSLVARAVPVDHWAPGAKSFWISIVNPVFTGRRLYVPTPAPSFF